MTNHFEPFALQLYRRHANGETIEQLASDLGIPEERVAQRIRVAGRFLEHRDGHPRALELVR